MNHYCCDVWFWRGMGDAEEARRFTERTWTNGQPDATPHANLARRLALPLLRVVGLAGQPVETQPAKREKPAARESCPCGGEEEFEYREPVFYDDEWALRCPECGHLDRLLWLSEEARPLVLGLARRRWRLRLRKAVKA